MDAMPREATGTLLALTAGVATVWDGKVLASVSLACSGLDEDAQRREVAAASVGS